MKYLNQFGIISGITLIGYILNSVLPLPVPASVWGMILMFIFLCCGIVKLDQVEKAADFLLSIMTVMFVPVGAGLIQSYSAIKNELVAIFTIIIISTVVSFFVTGKISQFIIQRKDFKEENLND